MSETSKPDASPVVPRRTNRRERHERKVDVERQVREVREWPRPE